MLPDIAFQREVANKGKILPLMTKLMAIKNYLVAINLRPARIMLDFDGTYVILILIPCASY